MGFPDRIERTVELARPPAGVRAALKTRQPRLITDSA
jgi:hypothetical protein